MNLFVPSPVSQVDAQSIAGQTYPQNLPLTAGKQVARSTNSLSGQLSNSPKEK